MEKQYKAISIQEQQKIIAMQSQMLDSLGCGVMAYTIPEHKMLVLNEEAKKIFNFYNKEHAKFADVLHYNIFPEDQAGVMQVSTMLRDVGDSASYQFRAVREGGGNIIVRCLTKLLEFEGGQKAILSIMQDVTEQENVRHKLEMERKQYRNVLTHNSAFSFIVDLTDGWIREDIVNKEGESLVDRMGLSVPVRLDDFYAAYERNLHPQIIAGDTGGCLHRSDLLKIHEKGKRKVEIEFYLPQEDSYFHTSFLLTEDDQTGHIYSLVIGRDMTEAKRETRKEAKERL